MNRRHILVDLDQVVYPWATVMAHVTHRLTEEGMEQGPEGMMNLYRTYEIWDDWGIPKGQFDHVWRQAIETGEAYGMGVPISDSVESLWRISDNEWHIHICTSRLNVSKTHDSVVTVTAAWLAKFGIPYRDLTFTEDKWRIQADAIVDDMPRHLMSSNARQRFLFPAPHNRDWAENQPGGRHVHVLNESDPWGELTEALGSGIIPG